MTYRTLLAMLKTFNDETLDQDVTVRCHGEYEEVRAVDFADVDDVLDKDHPYLVLRSEELE